MDMHDSIVKEISDNPNARWTATNNDSFSNFTVCQFRHILGVKPTPKQQLRSTPVISHPKSLKMPKSFDARTAVLHHFKNFKGIVALVGLLVLCNHYQIGFASILTWQVESNDKNKWGLFEEMKMGNGLGFGLH
ncbi:hypothetical protein F8388_014243 [Cannabis sativa]|uniref:Uncharacterized protein n=1 Tax=Cannabis sativa TaxID=3483 RepID=A0A7J6G830_CANSA|nr:hypothetical protein G4B88_015881 [Cannabis sativa]KAF4385110.1 hypothetical protein F8388_014243 [Cannabis sativa]